MLLLGGGGRVPTASSTATSTTTARLTTLPRTTHSPASKDPTAVEQRGWLMGCRQDQMPHAATEPGAVQALSLERTHAAHAARRAQGRLLDCDARASQVHRGCGLLQRGQSRGRSPLHTANGRRRAFRRSGGRRRFGRLPMDAAGAEAFGLLPTWSGVVEVGVECAGSIVPVPVSALNRLSCRAQHRLGECLLPLAMLGGALYLQVKCPARYVHLERQAPTRGYLEGWMVDLRSEEAEDALCVRRSADAGLRLVVEHLTGV